eukprot:2029934-Amphidinium_carterae.1
MLQQCLHCKLCLQEDQSLEELAEADCFAQILCGEPLGQYPIGSSLPRCAQAGSRLPGTPSQA